MAARQPTSPDSPGQPPSSVCLASSPPNGKASASTDITSQPHPRLLTTITEISKLLFRDLLLPFEVTSILILVAILGAVDAARRNK